MSLVKLLTTAALVAVVLSEDRRSYGPSPRDPRVKSPGSPRGPAPTDIQGRRAGSPAPVRHRSPAFNRPLRPPDVTRDGDVILKEYHPDAPENVGKPPSPSENSEKSSN